MGDDRFPPVQPPATEMTESNFDPFRTSCSCVLSASGASDGDKLVVADRLGVKSRLTVRDPASLRAEMIVFPKAPDPPKTSECRCILCDLASCARVFQDC